MNGKIVMAQDAEHIVVVGEAFDHIECTYKPCHHTALQRLHLEKWWLWVCADCFAIRDLEHMEAA